MTPDLERRVSEELSSGGRVLVSRLDYLGDVILTLPAVQAIRLRYPGAEVDYLSRSDGAEILDGEPMFSRVMRAPSKGENALATWRLVAQMRKRRYAAAVDLYSNPRSALLTWFSGAKLRVGGARRVRRHLYTHPTVVPAGIRSAIDHHLYYLKPLGVHGEASKPVLTVTSGEQERAFHRLRDSGISRGSERIVGIHPGGKWEVKRWPVGGFVDLAERLSGKRGMRVVVFIGPGEQSYQEALRERLGRDAVCLPVLPLRETAAIIQALDGMVVGDGGIMHVSVAVGTPTVGLFGSSEPDVWFPYEPFGPFVAAFTPIDCRPCHRHTCGHLSCLRGLRVDVVESKLIGVMEAAKEREGTGNR